MQGDYLERRREADGVFSSAKGEVCVIARSNGLDQRETEVFAEQLLLWFEEFASRPGNQDRPVGVLRAALISAACAYAPDFKGIAVVNSPERTKAAIPEGPNPSTAGGTAPSEGPLK